MLQLGDYNASAVKLPSVREKLEWYKVVEHKWLSPTKK